ncbi:MAG TPA: DEAD/DEAH box helicase [Kineosporiaceae bacterium]|nr:DEAD/DEAH box helicase [Kineosporiaceae bacterium]
MNLELSPLAEQLRRVTDEDLRALAGDRTFARGRSFASQNRVSALVADEASLSGTVRGNGGVYRVCVDLDPDGEILGGDCSCPVGVDCKHVVAAVLSARALLGSAAGSVPGRGGRLGLVPPVPKVPEWERVLGEVLSGTDTAMAFSPLGLLVDLRAPRGQGSRAAAAAPLAVALRPVVPGKTGWVRTGVSWSGLDYPRYGAPRLDPRQVVALQRLVHLSGSAHRYYSQPEWLDLAILGDGWMDALRHCRRVGVRLLTAQRGSGEVVLCEAPAGVSFRLVRAGKGGDLALTPEVRLPEEVGRYTLERPGWCLVGSPPSGVVARAGDDVLLAAFEPALDIATARVLGHGPLQVPSGDAGRFLSVAVPALAKRFEVGSPDGSVEIVVPGPPRLRLTCTHLPGLQLGLQWSFTYLTGTTTLSVPIDGTEHGPVRDRAAERELLAAARDTGLPPAVVAGSPVEGGPLPVAQSVLTGFAVVEFLDRVLPRLAALERLDIVVAGEPVEYVEATEPPQVQLRLTDSVDDHDWFDLSVEVTVATEPVPMALLVTALTLGEEHLVLPSGTWFRVDRPELVELRRLLEEARALQDGERGSLRLSAYQSDLWSELVDLGVVREQAERWAILVKGLGGAASTGSLSAPAALTAQLRPYQHDGFEWLTFLRRNGLGGVLADDMGLGKTLQVLAMIAEERQALGIGLDADPGADRAARAVVRPAVADCPDSGEDPKPWLVVAPTSVMGAWAGEAARFVPGLRVRVLGETAARRGVPVADVAAEADLVVTSYAVLRLDGEEFRAVRWAGVVVDEAQAVKNHQSITYQCVRRLHAPCRFVVSGTPMENNLMELWSLLSIAAPGLFPDPKAFSEYYRRPIESGAAPERLETLRRRIRPLMLRRTKQSVAADLPPKQEQVIRVDLPARHRRIYDRGLARERQRVLGLLEDVNRNRIAIFRSLTLLRQLSLHPGLVDATDDAVPCIKIDTLLELLLPVIAEGHQAIVFSQFTSFLRRVRDRLDAAGTPYSYLDGRTRNRQQAIESFRSGKAPVFLVSLKAGGTGLTLTEADYVFLLDPWWNPAAEAQAVDRAHRIGQDKPVNVYRLVSADTIEEKVLALQERKRELFASVIDDGAFSSGALTPADIQALVH